MVEIFICAVMVWVPPEGGAGKAERLFLVIDRITNFTRNGNTSKAAKKIKFLPLAAFPEKEGAQGGTGYRKIFNTMNTNDNTIPERYDEIQEGKGC